MTTDLPRDARSTDPQDDGQPISFRWRLDPAHAFAHEQAASVPDHTASSLPDKPPQHESNRDVILNWVRAEVGLSVNLAWGLALVFVMLTVIAGAGVAIGQTRNALLLIIVAQSLTAFLLATWAFWKSQASVKSQDWETVVVSRDQPDELPAMSPNSTAATRRRKTEQRTTPQQRRT